MPTRDEYAASIKSAFVSIGVRTTLANAAILWPFLANPIAQYFIEYFSRKYMTFLVNNGEMKVFFEHIDMRVAKQSKKFESAADRNHQVQSNPLSTAKEKADAEEELWAAFEPFARLDM